MQKYNSRLDKDRRIQRDLERPWYKHWKACRQRCNDVNASNYKYYGGKSVQCLLTEDEIKELYIQDNADIWRYKDVHQ